MKYLLLSFLILTSCKDVRNTTINSPGPDSPTSPVNLDGYYYLPSTGNLEIEQLDNGAYVFYGTQRIISDNADGTQALMPQLPTTQHVPVNGSIIGSTTLTFAAANNLKKDSDNSAINVARQVQYEIKMVNSKLDIVIKVFAANNINVDCTRRIQEP
jgi:hypothetical protein